VKDIRDRALAIAEYARRAQNTEAERQCGEIRIRAERKCGELTSEMLTARGQRSDLTSTQRASKLDALERAGVSRDQATRWERLAEIPAPMFEADLADPMWMPTTSGLLHRHGVREREWQASLRVPPQPVDDRALWLWGRLQDFERMGVLDADPPELLGEMFEHMQETTRRLAARVSCVPRLGWRRDNAQVGHHLGAKFGHHVLAQLRFGACGNTGCTEALAERGARIVAVGRHDADGARRRVTP
jgi:hypothetical protein